MPRILPILALCAACSGCAPGLGDSAAQAVTPPAPASTPRAIFAEYPQFLFDAIAASCEGPGRTVVRPSPDELRCEGLPPVEAAAALILDFDGTVEDLPRYVSSVAVAEAANGYLVTADTYIRIPQTDGAVRIVRLPDPELDALIRTVFEGAGGDLL